MVPFEDVRPVLDAAASRFPGILDPDEARACAYYAWVVAVKDEGLSGEDAVLYAGRCVTRERKRVLARASREVPLEGAPEPGVSWPEAFLDVLLSLPPVPRRVLAAALSRGGFASPAEARMVRNAAAKAGVLSCF